MRTVPKEGKRPWPGGSGSLSEDLTFMLSQLSQEGKGRGARETRAVFPSIFKNSTLLQVTFYLEFNTDKK